MRFRGYVAGAVALAALAASAGAASAGADDGSIWLSVPSDSASTIPGTPPDATFSPGPIDYNPTDTPAIYTVGPFLNNPTFSNQSAAFVAAGGANANMGSGTGNTFIDITGTVGLLSGANSFVLAHDDGVVLNITGFGTVLNEPGPTAENFSPFTVTNPGPAGNFAFNLQYVECCGPPATLQWTINDVTVGGVPEPATWAMMFLGVGFIGAGLRMVRRKDGMDLTTA
jgi:hypothetical protein